MVTFKKGTGRADEHLMPCCSARHRIRPIISVILKDRITDRQDKSDLQKFSILSLGWPRFKAVRCQQDVLRNV